MNENNLFTRGCGATGVAITAAAMFQMLAGAVLAQEPFGPTQNPLAGSTVFGEKGCIKCHSVNGLGGNLGPDLGQITQRRSFFELAAEMWNHLPGMTARMQTLQIERPEMSPREVGDLIAFLFTLDYFDTPGDIERGRRLFGEKKCSVCHQIRGYGGVAGPSLDFLGEYGSPIFVAAAMWNHGPNMAEAMAERGIERPTFEGADLVDLIAYLESVGDRPAEGPLYVLPGSSEAGRKIFQERSCNVCHSVLGEGGIVGPDLADRARQLSETEFAAAMWNKAPAMTSAMQERGIEVPELDAEDMSNILAYLYSVQYFAEAGDPERGRDLMRDKGCLACHSLDGQGSGHASDLARITGLISHAAVISDLWNHSALMEKTPEGQAVEWTKFTAAQMADLAAFFESVARRSP